MAIYNIEDLIEVIKNKIKGIKSIRKWDGISVECAVNDAAKLDKIQGKIRELCETNHLSPVSFEVNELNKNTFLFQLPDFEPVYLGYQIDKQYRDIFIFLLDNFSSHAGVNTSTDHLLEIHENMVKLAIQAYYRSNVNKYHVKESDMLNAFNLRFKLNELYKQVVLEYKDIKKGDNNDNN